MVIERLTSDYVSLKTIIVELNEKFKGLSALTDEKINNLKENTVKKPGRPPLKRRA